jgi:hypothetical protein
VDPLRTASVSAPLAFRIRSRLTRRLKFQPAAASARNHLAATPRPLLSLAFQRRPAEKSARNAVKFSKLLTETITDAEIPLRFEPGAAEAVARPVIETLKVWIAAHDPSTAGSDFEYGQKALIVQLLQELDDEVELPVEDAG